jgi:hypothetical protein
MGKGSDGTRNKRKEERGKRGCSFPYSCFQLLSYPRKD